MYRFGLVCDLPEVLIEPAIEEGVGGGGEHGQGVQAEEGEVVVGPAGQGHICTAVPY